MGFINAYFIKDLMENVNIEDVISDYVKLEKRGFNYFGLSPFQTEKSPSFCVDPKRNRYKDYSSGKSGNAITFLMDHQNLTYTQAVEDIANKYSIEVEYENDEYAKTMAIKEQKRKDLRPILLSCQKLFRDEFKKLPKKHPAKKEIYGHREYNDDIILDWGIGYAPGEKFIYDKVYNKGLTTEAAELGLINKDKRQDKHWNRITYPIHDMGGQLVGFATRDLSGKKKSAKWMNPPTSEIYAKDQIWFGLDRAMDQIVKTGEAWIVEGYNDVIAWHENEITNTIASSGTSIPYNLRKNLKRLCTRINICFDNDKAGATAMLKAIPMFLSEGFTVNVVRLNGGDPDDFVRLYARSIEFFGLPEMMATEGMKEDSFKILLEHNLKGSKLERSQGAQRLCQTIAAIEDEAMVEVYTLWLEKESEVSKSVLNKWVKKYRNLLEEETEQVTRYIMPKETKLKFIDVKDHVYNYGLFMDNNKIWYAGRESTDFKIHFNAISNFAIEIIQHMQDEKFPMKLLRVKNIHGSEKIFDVLSENLNQISKFDNAVTNFGNFQFNGDARQYAKLRSFLFDKMGTGRKVDVLGWQPEGFWVWNNKITVPGHKDIPLDENGICVFQKTHYYIPSANKIYSNNQFKYDAQKRFTIFDAKVNFQTYVAQMIKVHRDHAISAVLFSIASIFQDIIVKQNGSFPLMFLYGPGSSGKDQLADCMQSFFGVPQTAINLEGNASTIKAKIREFAQFSNSIGHLSEYLRGDHDGILKGLWDRRGYKRGNIESHVGTETIPIISSVILTGNEYPDSEPLIMRVFWNEMEKNQFNDDEMKEFDKLKDMTNTGISSFTEKILQHRDLFNNQFQNKYRGFKDSFAVRVPDAKSRMIQNTAVLGATYQIFKDILDFPFSFVEMENHFISSVVKQVRKCSSASILTRFWDCFLASMRGTRDDSLVLQLDYKLEDNFLYFNFTNVFNKIQRQWWMQYKVNSPGKTTLKDQLEKDISFVRYHSRGVYMGSGTSNTSALQIDIKKLEVQMEIIAAVEYKMHTSTPWDTKKDKENKESEEKTSKPPVTPTLFKILDDNKSEK